MEYNHLEAQATLPYELLVNREISWLEFNKRVLQESLDETVPLFERLKFSAIYCSNLDEFFMVRVGSLTDQALMEPERLDDKTGWTAQEQILRILTVVNECAALLEASYEKLRHQLREADIDLVDFTKLNKMEELISHKCFLNEIKPLLSPQVVDRHHPFPFLKNKEQYVATMFASKNEDVKLGIVPISHLPLYFALTIDNRRKLFFTADIVSHYAQELYNKYEIVERHVLRVTRNADISVDEGLFDFDVDFRGIMQELLKKRKRLSIVRVQISGEPSEKLKKYLCQKLGVGPEHMMARSIPLDFAFGFQLPGEMTPPHKNAVYKPLKASVPVDFSGKTGMRFLTEGDLLLSYPFQSMKPFIDLLYEAADDAAVVSIKISLYRLANHSRIVSALCYAAEKGKEIICVLELRARFDEQSNIDYAKLLENAGCTVIYGLSDYKIHAKLCLITRRMHNRITYITQIGTGNYNEKTSELYTDLSLITSDEAVGRDASSVFSALCMGEVVERTESLWVAPNCFLTNVLSMIDREIGAQLTSGDGYICIKVNSLNDMDVMKKLVEASQAGVRVELFIRGICCLRPGVPGYTDNVTVRSIVGRFLEHSRIFVFGSGAREIVYLGSGDLLNRNTRRRVEVFAQARSPRVRNDVLALLDAFGRDNRKAWVMQPDGGYVKANPDGEPLESQLYLHEYFDKPLQNAPARRSLRDRLRDGLHRLLTTR